ncbi:MAG: FAD:protein FMN transferase [Pseudomonadota bacterium]
MSKAIAFSRRTMLVLPFGLAACSFEQQEQIIEISGLTMGTYYKVKAVGAPSHLKQSDIAAGIEEGLAEVNHQLSNWNSSSEISRLNAARTTDIVDVSPMLAEVMNAAAEVNTLSAGRFDTTITPLIELWGFGAEGARNKAPSEAQIEQALANTGHGNTLEVRGNGVRKKVGDAQIFLSAIGKGYGADVIGRALANVGIENYLIEIGGDLYAHGTNEHGKPWRVGVETPQTAGRGVMEVVGISNLGMASSGDYRNYFEQDGVRYSHVIDPTTGKPITHHTASATVLAENAMLADAWATAMLTLGREAGVEIADKNGVAVMFIERDLGSQSERFKVTKNSLFEAVQA